MRLKGIRFQNYKAFHFAELPLEQLTVLIGPNGSGKSSALSAIDIMAKIVRKTPFQMGQMSPIDANTGPERTPSLVAIWEDGSTTNFMHKSNEIRATFDLDPNSVRRAPWLLHGRVFNLDPPSIAAASKLENTLDLEEDGGKLATVLTSLQDKEPELFEELNRTLIKWLPEYDRVLLRTESGGNRSFLLRTAKGRHAVPSDKLSDGTNISMALLTICHLPKPPKLLGLEEPDYGLHPRLLRHLKDALLRLTNPKALGIEREPTQVVVTTHSPYFLDLFRDELESIVIVKREELSSTFARLKDMPHLDDILKGSPSLGDVWYSGALGGVPEGL